MRQTIRRDRLIGAGDRIVIGLSGGADSVTLSVLLPEVAREFGAEVVALAHLNHGLRAAAEDDQRFCGEFAARLGLPFEIGDGGCAGAGARAADVDRGCRADCALRVPAAGDGAPGRRDADRGGPHPERSGRNGAAAAVPRRGAEGAGVDLPEGGTGDPAAAGRAARRDRRVRGGGRHRVPGGCDQPRRDDPEEPCASRAAAVSGAARRARGSWTCWPVRR